MSAISQVLSALVAVSITWQVGQFVWALEWRGNWWRLSVPVILMVGGLCDFWNWSLRCGFFGWGCR